MMLNKKKVLVQITDFAVPATVVNITNKEAEEMDKYRTIPLNLYKSFQLCWLNA